MYVQGRGHSLPAELGGMRRLHTLVCEGCSSLSGAPLAGLPALATLSVCRLNRLTYVCDETCRDLALLPKVWHVAASVRTSCSSYLLMDLLAGIVHQLLQLTTDALSRQFP